MRYPGHMKTAAVAAFLIVVVSVVVYWERLQWPPYKNELQDMFSQSRSTLEQIESEMISDGLPAIGSGLNRARRHEDTPELTDAQADKYAALFGELPFYTNVVRIEDRTHVWLVTQETHFRVFQFAFVRGDPRDRLPQCDDANKFADCGECYVPLDAGWHLEYRWSDESGIPSVDGCIPFDSAGLVLD